MKRILSLLLLLSFNFCVTQPNAQTEKTFLPENNNNENRIDQQSFQPSDTIVKLPQFFSELYKHHYPEIRNTWQEAFNTFCERENLSKSSAENQKAFLELQFYHQLFTSDGVRNCSTGGILNIPYLWHWVTPNPRHEIEYLPKSKPLKEIKPGKEFSRYRSMADVDRVPSVFFKDLVTETPQYEHPSCGEFYTFGWCSEREMAFVQLLSNYGYRGKVVASGNHSWSAFLIFMENDTGEKIPFEISIDNTFDGIIRKRLPGKPNAKNWQSDFGKGKLPAWYNKMANSGKQRKSIQNINVSKAVMTRINALVETYWK